MPKPRICIVTGSRADYGLLRPLMAALRDAPDFTLQVLATGMHLAPEFGLTYQAIEADGFGIDAQVEMLLSSDTARGVAKSVGLGVIGCADALAALQPDLLLVLGDRFEILAAVQAALFARIPVAHIAGGDLTEGAVDDAIRHSITKMAHLHFVTNDDAARRVRQLGEDPRAIFTVGSPGIDNLKDTPLLDRAHLEAALDLRLRARNLLVTFHPSTLEATPADTQLRELFAALDSFGPELGLIFTKPNADMGGRDLARAIDDYVATREQAAAFTSLGNQRYYSAIAQVDAVVGNSSSGLYEVPSFGKPTVNIGDRQKGRLRATSVIDCAPIRAAIRAAIETALTRDCRDVVNPYGDGQAVERILNVLRAMLRQPLDTDALVQKHFFDQVSAHGID
ncbi:MAG: UDP-N-acetylglucosamine 2-epimerase (hydrolyzing) [Gammaproteobacteria bacterium]|nr:UDP-N-acetylglucosamine 2-epimerase (hydrolyzing) [Gammaproteobacteria bacterium]